MIELLNFPLDPVKIFKHKKALKDELLLNNGLLDKKIAIMGGSTTSEVKNILELFLLKRGIRPEFYESEYNKYYEESVFNDELKAFRPDLIYIHTSFKNLKNLPLPSMNEGQVETCLAKETSKLKEIWKSLESFRVPIIQNNFELPEEILIGNKECSDFRGQINFVIRVNHFINEETKNNENLYINDINYLSSKLGLSNWHDSTVWFTAKYLCSYMAIPHLAKELSITVASIFLAPKKCIIVDLDNTLWGGVVGDDGLSGIDLGYETPTGEAFLNFQDYLRKLKLKGILLAICSKNEFENAILGLSHSASILKENDFTVIKANWKPKHENIVEIAKELNIGLDSLVFLDDNPVERQIVRENLGMVAVPEIGSEVENYVKYIYEEGYFNNVSLLKEDVARADYYEKDKIRKESELRFKDYCEFLASLEMRADIIRFSKDNEERITQLINKTNQFNFTTLRVTASESKLFRESNDYISLSGALEDKFGPNGIVSIIVGKLTNQICVIEIFLMSCRVLKRELEYAMINELVSECKKRSVVELIGIYRPTGKNEMVREFYKELGFILVSEKDDEYIWSLSLDNYFKRSTQIRINNE